MKISKVVRVEVTTAPCGNTEINLVFGVLGVLGVLGTRQNPFVHLFTETNRISLGWYEGYDFRFYDGWEIPAPTVHPTETPTTAVLAALEASIGVSRWAGFEYAPEFVDGYTPSHGSFQSFALEF